jgi:membrane protease subunit HflC
MKKEFIIPAIVIALIVAFKSLFIIVDVTEHVVITQLGKPIKSYSAPGLYFKLPFIQNAIFMSKKLIEYDAKSSEILTMDKKALVIDNYCRWRIADPLKFYLTVRDYRSAFHRLDDIIYSEMRNELGKHDLIDVIKTNRGVIMANVTTLAREKALEYGIDIHDVRIKRADLPPQNERAVYERMKAERNRIAKQYRSEGMEESQIIKATTEKERAMIISEAYRKVQELKGETDAQVINIYASAYNKDPQFFEFYKTLEVYKNVLTDNNTNMFLTTDSKLFKLMQRGE